MRYSTLFCSVIIIPALAYLLCTQSNAIHNKANNKSPIYLHEQPSSRSWQTVFDSFTHNGKVISIFYADWCKYCTRMIPIIDDLARTLPEVTFLKVNRDYFMDLAKEYQTKGIPTFLFFDNGKLIKHHFGSMSKEEMIEMINSVYKNLATVI